MQNQSLAAYVQSKFLAWKAARTDMEKKWLSYYRTERCIPNSADATKRSERSQIKIPATKEAIKNFVYSASSILFAADPWFDLAPTNPASRRPSTLKQYFRWLMAKEMFEEKVRGMLHEMATYGTTVGRVLPKKHTRKRQLRQTVVPTDPQTGQPLDQIETLREVTDEYIYPCLDPVSIYNYYTNPTATGTSRLDSEGGIVRHWLTRSQLEDLLDAGVISRLPDETNSEVRGDQSIGSGVTGAPVDASSSLYQRLGLTGLQTSGDMDRFEVLEWHGYIPQRILDADAPRVQSPTPSAAPAFAGGMDQSVLDAQSAPTMDEPTPSNPRVAGEKVLWVYGTEILNDDIEPPDWWTDRPFVSARFEARQGEFYGSGIAEATEGPQRALDATVRARIDNLAISLNSMFAVAENKLVPGQNMDVYAGKIWRVYGNPQEAIHQFTVQDVTGSTYPASQQYEQWIQAAHGINPVLGGRSQKSGQQTATEVSTLAGQAMGQVKEIAKAFENTVLEPVLRLYSQILIQFPNPEESFAAVGPQGIQVLQMESNELSADLAFIPMGVIQMETRNQGQKIMNFLAGTANPIDAPWINRPKLLQRAYEAMGIGTGDSNEVIFSLDAPPMAIQMMQMQMMQGGPGGAASQPAPESAQPGTMLPPTTAPGGTPGDMM